MNYGFIFEKSREDVPVLIIYELNRLSIFNDSSLNVIAIHTGDAAEKMWHDMTDRVQVVPAKELLPNDAAMPEYLRKTKEGT